MASSIKPTVLLSKSKDGEILNDFLSRFGIKTVRGSSSKSGASAIKSLLADENTIFIAVDGPRGPAFEIKPGGEFVAEKSSKRKIGAFIKVDRAWRLNSWDRTIIPKPFAKLEINFFKIEDDLKVELLRAEAKEA